MKKSEGGEENQNAGSLNDGAKALGFWGEAGVFRTTLLKFFYKNTKKKTQQGDDMGGKVEKNYQRKKESRKVVFVRTALP